MGCFACGVQHGSGGHGPSHSNIHSKRGNAAASSGGRVAGVGRQRFVCGPCVHQSTLSALATVAALETESSRTEARITVLLQQRGAPPSGSLLSRPCARQPRVVRLASVSPAVRVEQGGGEVGGGNGGMRTRDSCAVAQHLIEATASLRASIVADRASLAIAREELRNRSLALAAANNTRGSLKAAASVKERDSRAAADRLARCTEITTTCRRMLMKELVGVFRLRRVQRAPPQQSTLPPAFGIMRNGGTGRSSLPNSDSPSTKFPAVASSSPVPTISSQNTTASISISNSASSAIEAHKRAILDTPALKASPNASTAVSLFYDTPLEFRLINVGFSCFGDYYLYPREKFNAALGHIAHMTVVMCHYLGVSLPFQIVYGGSKSHISPGFFDAKAFLGSHGVGVASGSGDGATGDHRSPRGFGKGSLMPLYLDSNLDIFTVGLVMLNYDILYLCWTQGVLIPLHQAANTLENLAACCRASKLGRDVNQWLDLVAGSAAVMGASSGSMPNSPKPNSRNYNASLGSPSSGGKTSSVSSPMSPKTGSVEPATSNEQQVTQQPFPDFTVSFKTLYLLHVALRKRPKPTPSSTASASTAPSKSSKRNSSILSTTPPSHGISDSVHSAGSGISLRPQQSTTRAGSLTGSLLWAASSFTSTATKLSAEAVSMATSAMTAAIPLGQQIIGAGVSSVAGSSSGSLSQLQEEDVEGGMGMIIVDERTASSTASNPQQPLPQNPARGPHLQRRRKSSKSAVVDDETEAIVVEEDEEDFGFIVNNHAVDGAGSRGGVLVRVDPAVLALSSVLDRGDVDLTSAASDDESTGGSGGHPHANANEWLIL